MSDSIGFSKEQQAYLQGLVLGNDVARTIRNLPVLSGSATHFNSKTSADVGLQSLSSLPENLPVIHWEAQERFLKQGKMLVPEEKAKREKNGLGFWSEIEQKSLKNEYPEGTDLFMTKYQGLFYVAPAQNSFMCRMRLPGGVVRSDQLQGLATLADRFAGAYVDVTTRANLQLREIESKNAMEVLMGLRELGIVSLGSGADNVRNVTASPLSGIDPRELIETIPLARQLHFHILNKPELYGLPRKFNIAFDGSGQVSSLAETNDISFHAVTFDGADDGVSEVRFLLGLGGITGHGDFARPTGVLVAQEECVSLCEAILRVFIMHGDRTDRKKARLKYLLDAWGFDKFLAEVETQWGRKLNRVAIGSYRHEERIDRWAHVDFHSQKQTNLAYVGVVLPVGRITTDQLRGLAAIASQFGSGNLRLTVWQNLLIPDIPNEAIEPVKKAIEAIGLGWKRTSVRAGLVACTGSEGCKFAASDTKGDAMEIAKYIEERFDLEEPINIHVTGCHHSCAQHAIGDIGLVATKVSIGDEMLDGYHILLGGRTGSEPRIARPLFQSILASEAPMQVAWMIERYLARTSSESHFAEWAFRQDPSVLRGIFESEREDMQCNRK